MTTEVYAEALVSLVHLSVPICIFGWLSYSFISATFGRFLASYGNLLAAAKSWLAVYSAADVITGYGPSVHFSVGAIPELC